MAEELEYRGELVWDGDAEAPTSVPDAVDKHQASVPALEQKLPEADAYRLAGISDTDRMHLENERARIAKEGEELQAARDKAYVNYIAAQKALDNHVYESRRYLASIDPLGGAQTFQKVQENLDLQREAAEQRRLDDLQKIEEERAAGEANAIEKRKRELRSGMQAKYGPDWREYCRAHGIAIPELLRGVEEEERERQRIEPYRLPIDGMSPRLDAIRQRQMRGE